MFKKTLTWLKEKWQQIIKSNASPGEISLGLAIGVFCGIIPLLGLQTLIMVLLLFLLRRSNKMAAFLSSWVMNQFTIIPILYMDYKIGMLLIPVKTELDFSNIQQLVMDWNLSELFSVGKEVFYPMLLGGCICGLIGAIITYAVAFFSLQYKRKAHLSLC